MLHLIPAWLHRQLYRLGHCLRRLWLRASKAPVHGCTIIGRDAEGRVLLVRHSYGAPVWAFPGGGMKPHEDAQGAALRELQEELGCTLTDPVFVGRQEDVFLGAPNHVRIFTGLVTGEPRPDMREVVEARFFARDALPANLSRTVRTRLRALDAGGGKGDEQPRVD